MATRSSKVYGTPPLLLGSQKFHSPNLQGTWAWKDTGQRQKEAAPVSAESGLGAPSSVSLFLTRGWTWGYNAQAGRCGAKGAAPRALSLGPAPWQQPTRCPLRGLLRQSHRQCPPHGLGACGARNGRKMRSTPTQGADTHTQRTHGSPWAQGGRPLRSVCLPPLLAGTPTRWLELTRQPSGPGRCKPRAEDGGINKTDWGGGCRDPWRCFLSQMVTREKAKSLTPSTPMDFRPCLPNRHTELLPSSAAPRDHLLSWCPPPHWALHPALCGPNNITRTWSRQPPAVRQGSGCSGASSPPLGCPTRTYTHTHTHTHRCLGFMCPVLPAHPFRTSRPLTDTASFAGDTLPLGSVC